MFDIVTFCSEGYDKAINFSVPSWLTESGCGQIVIYSYGKVGKDWKNVDKIEFREEFEPVDHWHTWALRKPTVLKWYLDTVQEGQRFCLMDLDCFAVNGSWTPAFQEGWLGAIRWDKTIEDASSKKAAAVFFGTKCKQMDMFADYWIELTQQFNIRILHLKGTQGTEQIAYQFSLKHISKDVNGIYPLNENIWSNERDNLDEWKAIVHKYRDKVKILHFKGGRWKDYSLYTEIRGLVNGI